VIAASALIALAAWPLLNVHHSPAPAAPATPAPVIDDWRYRDRTIAFYERAVAQRPDDQIVARMLASAYVMRFRETYDVGDLWRAEHEARRSLRNQPRYNYAGEQVLASALFALHRFREALRYATDASVHQPYNGEALAQRASLLTELGDYAEAERLFSRPLSPRDRSPSWDVAMARYDEVTGHLAQAIPLVERGMVEVDGVFSNPAEARAWYHFRLGELQFASGHVVEAERRYREALTIYPDHVLTLTQYARLLVCEHRWHEALAIAQRGARLVPFPELLGYVYDAQTALGDVAAAARARDTIATIERIGNGGGLNDRLIALFYADHGIRLDEAVRIARRDKRTRDDVFAEDTLAWALAMDGKWREARIHMRRALRFDTEEARLQYHAAIVALHFGRREEAKRRLERALTINPAFHPAYADDARRRLGTREQG